MLLGDYQLSDYKGFCCKVIKLYVSNLGSDEVYIF